MLRAASVLFRPAVARGVRHLAFLAPPFRSRPGLTTALARRGLDARIALGAGLEATWFAFVHKTSV
jgi:hypothetical protein